MDAYEDIHITSSIYSGGFTDSPNTRSNFLNNELVEQESSSGFIPDESDSDSSTEIEIPSSSKDSHLTENFREESESGEERRVGEQGCLSLNLFVNKHIQNTRHELITHGAILVIAEEADVLSDIATFLRCIGDDILQRAELDHLIDQISVLARKKVFRRVAW